MLRRGQGRWECLDGPHYEVLAVISDSSDTEIHSRGQSATPCLQRSIHD